MTQSSLLALTLIVLPRTPIQPVPTVDDLRYAFQVAPFEDDALPVVQHEVLMAAKTANARPLTLHVEARPCELVRPYHVSRSQAIANAMIRVRETLKQADCRSDRAFWELTLDYRTPHIGASMPQIVPIPFHTHEAIRSYDKRTRTFRDTWSLRYKTVESPLTAAEDLARVQAHLPQGTSALMSPCGTAQVQRWRLAEVAIEAQRISIDVERWSWVGDTPAMSPQAGARFAAAVTLSLDARGLSPGVESFATLLGKRMLSRIVEGSPPEEPPFNCDATAVGGSPLDGTGSALLGYARAISLVLWELTVVKSAVGLAILFAGYALIYWLVLFVTRSYFIEIAAFRIWKDPAPAYLERGLASLLADELLRLQRDVSEHGRPGEGSEFGLRLHKVRFLPPVAAQVTIEVGGVSLEAMNAFLRRLLHRHTLMTCDVIVMPDSLRLIGRSPTAGPWETDAPKVWDAKLFGNALQEFAVRAVVEIQPGSRKAVANALAYKQHEAYSEDDHDEALRLATLGLVALPDHAVQFFNLGSAYQQSVRNDDAAAVKQTKLEAAIDAYSDAIDRDERFAWAYADRGIAYVQLGELGRAKKDLDEAGRLDPHDFKVKAALAKLVPFLRDPT